jgi:hypothetical protein
MIKFKTFQSYGDQRIEVELTNGQHLTVFVDPETGKLSILSDMPHVIGTQATNKTTGFPINVVPIEYYGYPSE